MMMMDKNNGAVADVIQHWLVEQGLTDTGGKALKRRRGVHS